ncbi:MAG: hydantoinase B/oxoprolinase family protein, partial [Nitrospinota bacterium]
MPAPRAPALGEGLDPVRFEVIRSALLALTEEMGETLRRAAYSTNIKTRTDFSCACFDSELRTVAQAFAQPSHLGSLAQLVPRALEEYGAERLGPGDGLLINHPYLGGVHLNDITLISPVYAGGRPVAYVANIAHHVDVGGAAPGSIGAGREIYSEGLIIPPVRLVKGGEIDPEIFALVRANVRGEKEVAGDFRAQTAANRIGAQRLGELFGRFGAEELRRYMAALIDYSRRRTEAELADFPAGRYEARGEMDDDGMGGGPVRLRVAVEKVGDRIRVDLTGSDAQRAAPTNATFAQSYSAVVYVLKCLVDPDIPVNDGFYQVVEVVATPGTVVCAQAPAPVVAGWEVAVQVCDLLFEALAPALPERVIAGTKGCICNIAFGGKRPEAGEYFTFYETIAGGYGASFRADGMDAVQAHFQNTENAPVEETETHYPVRILRYELIPDSEGAGRFRGGLGVRRDYLFPGHTPVFSVMSDRAKNPPRGLFGGQNARPASYLREVERGGLPMGSKA